MLTDNISVFITVLMYVIPVVVFSQLMTALVEKNCRTDLRHIIEKRIGLEHFTDKLSQLPKNESYSHAAKKPQLTCKQPSEVIFDYEFTKLFKQLESKFVILCITYFLIESYFSSHNAACMVYLLFCLSLCPPLALSHKLCTRNDILQPYYCLSVSSI